ncbi:phospho-N-acetylmuramoyl-pentapeptide-transferase [Candidatus Desantisbacteria bacterium]|nr:phospho-N-acetylmuramoyl-pentapeptide-transferase [Candidatus Desantisbacteria bacterium]
MFYYIYQLFHYKVSYLRLFRYITVRSVFGAITAFLISILLGPYVIRKLKELKVGQTIRDEGPDTHKGKSGTPTMGGILILMGIIIPTILWSNLNNSLVWLLLFTTIWLGTVGFIDDYLKLTRKNSDGLAGRYKLIGQITIGLFIGIYLYFNHPPMGELWKYKFEDSNYVNYINGHYTTKISIPFLKNTLFDLGWFYIPFVILIIVSSSNAVNLTDGLDGLAIGAIIFCMLSYTIITYVVGNWKISQYLNLIYVEGSGELTVYCASLIGAALGFLWFNSYPAQMFMGDTGSLSLGGVIGLVAIITKKELLLLIVGGVFVIEALSVIIQVVFYKWKKKRIFLMAPLHHHFELKGLAEPKIIIRFWILSIIFTLLSLVTLKIQ